MMKTMKETSRIQHTITVVGKREARRFRSKVDVNNVEACHADAILYDQARTLWRNVCRAAYCGKK